MAAKPPTQTASEDLSPRTMETQKDEPRVCRHCGKVLKSYQGFRDHERAHEGKAPFICCGLRFYSKTHIQRHRCAKHGEEKRFRCCECGRHYSSEHYLKVHQKCHTTPEKKCDVCGVSIKKSENLRDHLDKHTNEKSHRCACGRTYRYKTNLYRHQKKCNTD